LTEYQTIAYLTQCNQSQPASFPQQEEKFVGNALRSVQPSPQRDGFSFVQFPLAGIPCLKYDLWFRNNDG